MNPIVDMTGDESCKEASEEIRAVLDKYAVLIAIDVVTTDRPIIFMITEEESGETTRLH